MANVSEEDMTEITDAIMVFDREGDNKLAVEDITRCLRALGRYFLARSAYYFSCTVGFRKLYLPLGFVRI